MGAVSLWALVPLWQFVGVVAGSEAGWVSPVLVAGVCVVLGMGSGFRLWIRLGWLGRPGMATVGTGRLVSSVVGWVWRALRLGRRTRRLGWALGRNRSAARGRALFERGKFA